MSSLSAAKDAATPAEAASRGPVLFLAASALSWTAVALLLSLAASLRLQFPGPAASWDWTSYARLEAAGRDAFAYGFAIPAGLALGLWALSKSAGVRTPAQGFLALSGVFWNVGVTVGLAGILAGESSGFRWMEFNKETWVILLTSYASIFGWVLAAYGRREQAEMPPALWYAMGALLAGAWLLGTGAILAWMPLRGVAQAMTAGWYAQAFQYLWIFPLALSATYAALPETSPGRRPYGALGFWGWFLLAGWTAASPWVGGPVPAWAPTVSVAAGVVLVMPVALIGLDLSARITGKTLSQSPAGGWAALGAASFVAAGAAGSLTSLRCAQRILHFTVFPAALEDLGLYGVAGLGLFAGLYAALPGLAGVRWPFRALGGLHLASAAGGLLLMVAPAAVGGFWQGFRLDDPAADVNSITQGLWWVFALRSLGLLTLLAGQAAFAANLALMVFRAALPWREPALRWAFGAAGAAEAK